MKNELPHSNQDRTQNEPSLDARFATRPELRRRRLGIADRIDQAVAEGGTAHAAEARASAHLRQLGQAVVTDWAEKAAPSAGPQAQAGNPELIGNGKKG